MTIFAYVAQQDDWRSASAELTLCVSLHWLGLADLAAALQDQHVHGLS